MAKKKFTVVSLFSGGMGLDLGLEQTCRFRIVACVEKERSFCETIRTNREAGRLDPELKVFEGDISDLSPQTLLNAVGLIPGEIDLLVGGPPCQSFSTAGKRAATQDPRGTLLWQYLRFIEALQPKFFLIENVRGLLSAALNHRPIAIGDLHETDPIVMDFSPRKKGFLALVPPGSNWRSLPVEVQKESMGKAWFAKGGRSGWWRRLTFDLPCPTLVTMPNHASTSLCHPTECRALSLREYARIQEFPDDWVFRGKTMEQYAQAGNAVPVRLGRVAGEVIAAELDQLQDEDWKPNLTKPDACRIVYVQSHVRTRQWFKGGETFVWEDEGGDQPTYAAPKTKRRSKRI